MKAGAVQMKGKPLKTSNADISETVSHRAKQTKFPHPHVALASFHSVCVEARSATCSKIKLFRFVKNKNPKLLNLSSVHTPFKKLHRSCRCSCFCLCIKTPCFEKIFIDKH